MKPEEPIQVASRVEDWVFHLARAFKALPLALFGAIWIVWLIEGHIARRQDMSTIYAIEWRRTGQAPRKKEVVASPILCFGTSLTRFGISPRVLEETLHLPAYNLALSGGQPFPSYLMLQRSLAAGAKPRAILVDFMWMTIGKDHTYNQRLVTELLTLRDCAEFAWAAQDLSFFGQVAAATLIPSYRARQEVRTNIDFALRGWEPPRVPERLLYDRNMTLNRGALHVPLGKAKVEFDPDHPVIFQKVWSCSPVSERYIDKFLGLASSHKIPVFWLIPPLPEATTARLTELGVQPRFLQFVETMRALHPEVIVLDGSNSRYEPSAFFDMIHLDRDGAVVWSASVAAAVKRHLESPQTLAGAWEHLPNYHPDAMAARIEDIDKTNANLRAMLDRVRR
jgi:hypothetical protein